MQWEDKNYDTQTNNNNNNISIRERSGKGNEVWGEGGCHLGSDLSVWFLLFFVEKAIYSELLMIKPAMNLYSSEYDNNKKD